jgi:hypothetical protein
MHYTNNNVITITKDLQLNVKKNEHIDKYPYGLYMFMFHPSYILSSYSAVYYKTHDTTQIIKQVHESIILYNNVYSTFLLSYMLFSTYLSKYNNKNFLNISNSLRFVEVILYYNLNNNKNITITHLESLFFLMDTEHARYFTDLEKIKNVYQIPYDVDTSYNRKNISLQQNVNEIIQKYKDKKFDLIAYSFPNYSDYFHARDQLLFAFSIIILNILEIGGNIILDIAYVNKNILRQITYFLSLYFEKIVYPSASNVKHLAKKRIIFLNLKKHISESDNNILSDILKDWNKIELDKSHDNSFVNSILSFGQTDNKYDLFFEKLYDKIYTVKFMEHVNKLLDNDITNLTMPQILSFHNKTTANNLQYNISLCKQYGFVIKPKYLHTNDLFKNKLLRNMFIAPKIIDFKIINYTESMDDMKDIEQKLKLNKISYDIDASQFKYDNYHILSINHLQQNKSKLNLMKFTIDSRDREKWATTTTLINIPKYIVLHIKTLQNFRVSRAFIKMYELLTNYDLVDASKDVKSFHTCEMPGNFISAINHYIKSKHPSTKFDWYANSLNPYNQKNKQKYGDIISDDYGYLKKYKDRWLWGTDDTGDITKKSNIEFFQKKFNYSIDLFTSDCGLGAQDQGEMMEQEKKLAILNFCQVLISLLVLKEGGNAVFKLFIPIAEPITLSILYLIVNYFDETILVKQASGSPGSSEIYCVALKKNKHLSEVMKNYLFSCLQNFDPNKSLFPSLPPKFMLQIEDISTEFVNKQVDYLYRSFFYNDYPEVLNDHKPLLELAKQSYAKNWIKMNNFGPIDNKYKL